MGDFCIHSYDLCSKKNESQMFCYTCYICYTSFHSSFSISSFLYYYPNVSTFMCNTMTFHHFPPRINRPPKAMLFTSKSITPRLQKHCFQTVRTMLLASKSNAPGLRKQCSWPPKAMLWALRSYALEVTEQCSGGYGAMLCKVWSSALDGHMRCRR